MTKKEIAAVAKEAAEDIRLLLSIVRAMSGEDPSFEASFAENLAKLDKIAEGE